MVWSKSVIDAPQVICDPFIEPELFWTVLRSMGTVALIIAAQVSSHIVCKSARSKVNVFMFSLQIRLMPALPFVRSVYTWFDDIPSFVQAVNDTKGKPGE